MFGHGKSDEPEGARWLLRPTDQVVVASLVLVGFALTVVWWTSHGGWTGRLRELEAGRPKAVGFQVDLNVAGWPELAQLPGVGPTLARRIVDSRQTEGPFRRHNDLTRVHGIGPKRLEKMLPYLRPMPPGIAPAEP